jgi:hypothetical protein
VPLHSTTYLPLISFCTRLLSDVELNLHVSRRAYNALIWLFPNWPGDCLFLTCLTSTACGRHIINRGEAYHLTTKRELIASHLEIFIVPGRQEIAIFRKPKFDFIHVVT